MKAAGSSKSSSSTAQRASSASKASSSNKSAASKSSTSSSTQSSSSPSPDRTPATAEQSQASRNRANAEESALRAQVEKGTGNASKSAEPVGTLRAGLGGLSDKSSGSVGVGDSAGNQEVSRSTSGGMDGFSKDTGTSIDLSTKPSANPSETPSSQEQGNTEEGAAGTPNPNGATAGDVVRSINPLGGSRPSTNRGNVNPTPTSAADNPTSTSAADNPTPNSAADEKGTASKATDTKPSTPVGADTPSPNAATNPAEAGPRVGNVFPTTNAGIDVGSSPSINRGHVNPTPTSAADEKGTASKATDTKPSPQVAANTPSPNAATNPAEAGSRVGNVFPAKNTGNDVKPSATSPIQGLGHRTRAGATETNSGPTPIGPANAGNTQTPVATRSAEQPAVQNPPTTGQNPGAAQPAEVKNQPNVAPAEKQVQLETPMVAKSAIQTPKERRSSGLASTMMVLQGAGKDKAAQRLAGDEKAAALADPQRKTSGAAIADSLSDKGLPSKFKPEGDQKDLVKAIDNGQPVPLHMSGLKGEVTQIPGAAKTKQGLRVGDTLNRDGDNAKDWVTVTGYSGPASNPTSYTVNDPRSGAVVQVQAERLEKMAGGKGAMRMVVPTSGR